MRSNFFSRTRRVAVVLLAAMIQVSSSSFAVGVSVDHGGYRPHYQGFGVKTVGGRGGAILRVTNLNDSGPGSLRAALEASGPRYVIFETSGTISLAGPIDIVQPFITVAGQTAPSPGITIRYNPIQIDTNDVVLQHLRIRMGDKYYSYPDNKSNALYVRDRAFNVVLDHLSLSWSVGSILSVASANFQQVSVLDCLLAYSLRIGTSETGMAALNAFSYIGEVTYARNLFVHNSNRSPWFGAGIRGSAINNVIYGSGNSGGDPQSQFGFMQLMLANYAPYGETTIYWNLEAVAQNNRFISSAGTGTGLLAGTNAATKSIDVWLDGNDASRDSRLYLSGNIGPHMTLADQWGGVDFYDVGSRAGLDYVTVPDWHASFAYDLIAPDALMTSVTANAGARPLDRDSVDVTAVKQALAGDARDLPNMGARIVSPNDMGGWPALAVNTRALQVPVNPNAVAPGQVFRTNIEMWLESAAQALEPATRPLDSPKSIRFKSQ